MGPYVPFGQVLLDSGLGPPLGSLECPLAEVGELGQETGGLRSYGADGKAPPVHLEDLAPLICRQFIAMSPLELLRLFVCTLQARVNKVGFFQSGVGGN